MAPRLELHEPRCDGQRSMARPTQLLPMCWHCERRLVIDPGVNYTWFAEPPAVQPDGPNGRWTCEHRRPQKEPTL